ncbi:MAG: DUF2905 domain-containing protein [Deltaproteobacteria bacterium]|nr:DUF2905 domain-containing protein [Deltaproteobacteria bacterium]MBW2098607.1 DUF2905 domain-containing protein [Deltaproteobacteria bacterium]PXF50801.1 MAG: DUF2905 domain-containing protein [Deltaproteobacteria bacterium]
MNPLPEFGKMLLILGILFVVTGLFLMLGPKIPLLGRLPGDFVIRRGNFTLYFPLATSILLSIVLTLIFSIFRK